MHITCHNLCHIICLLYAILYAIFYAYYMPSIGKCPGSQRRTSIGKGPGRPTKDPRGALRAGGLPPSGLRQQGPRTSTSNGKRVPGQSILLCLLCPLCPLCILGLKFSTLCPLCYAYCAHYAMSSMPIIYYAMTIFAYYAHYAYCYAAVHLHIESTRTRLICNNE